MQIRIKQKGGLLSPPKLEKQNQKIFNIIPITQAKNKDFLKIITKSYPESLRNWVLKTYPRKPKGDSESPAQIININEWRSKMKTLTKNIVIGISAIVGSMFFNFVFLAWFFTEESNHFTNWNDILSFWGF